MELNTEKTVVNLIEILFKANKKIRELSESLEQYGMYKDDCTFCNGEGEDDDLCSPTGDHQDASHLRMLDGDIIEYEYDDGETEILDSFQINFCPMCGRNLL